MSNQDSQDELRPLLEARKVLTDSIASLNMGYQLADEYVRLRTDEIEKIDKLIATLTNQPNRRGE